MHATLFHFSMLFVITLLNLSLGFAIACHCGWGPEEWRGWLTKVSRATKVDQLADGLKACLAESAAVENVGEVQPGGNDLTPELSAHSFTISGMLAGLEAALTTSLGTLTTIQASLEQEQTLSAEIAERACSDTDSTVRELLQRIQTTSDRLEDIQAELPNDVDGYEALTMTLAGLHSKLQEAAQQLPLLSFAQEAWPNAASQLREIVARIIQIGDQAGAQLEESGVWEQTLEGE